MHCGGRHLFISLVIGETIPKQAWGSGVDSTLENEIHLSRMGDHHLKSLLEDNKKVLR